MLTVFIWYRNVTDRRTDGRTDLLYQYRASVCWRAIKISHQNAPEHTSLDRHFKKFMSPRLLPVGRRYALPTLHTPSAPTAPRLASSALGVWFFPVRYVAALTWHASIGDVEVGREIFRTRLDKISQRGNAELAGATPGARPVDQIKHIRRAANVAVVTCHAPATQLTLSCIIIINRASWLRGTVVERWSLTGELSLTCGWRYRSAS